ncbi:unknown [Megasphaera elsdenii CAG:570]|uniref:Uncharacterized protein n=1 Tax=Megasphaera elsdenii CAG:570 TaxID=1263087 RepID=R7MY19_MEGEL|nr:unknown [Megasphaera elsdenii CAG:570]
MCDKPFFIQGGCYVPPFISIAPFLGPVLPPAPDADGPGRDGRFQFDFQRPRRDDRPGRSRRGRQYLVSRLCRPVRYFLRHLADHRPAPGCEKDRRNPAVHHAEPVPEPGLYSRHFPGRCRSHAALPRLHGPRRAGPLHRLGIPQGPGPGAGPHLPAGDDALYRRRPRQDPRFHDDLSHQPGPDDSPLPPAHLRRRSHSGHGRHRHGLCHHHRVVAVFPALCSCPAVDGTVPVLSPVEPPAARQLASHPSPAGIGHSHLYRRLLRNEPVLHRRPVHGRVRHAVPGRQPGRYQLFDPDVHPALEHQPDGDHRHRL